MTSEGREEAKKRANTAGVALEDGPCARRDGREFVMPRACTTLLVPRRRVASHARGKSRARELTNASALENFHRWRLRVAYVIVVVAAPRLFGGRTSVMRVTARPETRPASSERGTFSRRALVAFRPVSALRILSSPRFAPSHYELFVSILRFVSTLAGRPAIQSDPRITRGRFSRHDDRYTSFRRHARDLTSY